MGDFGATPLRNAVERNNVSIVTAFLSVGADVNMTSQHRILAVSDFTPLMAAVALGFRFTIMTILLSAGASINAVDSNGDMPIHHFAHNRSDTFGVTAGLSVLLEEGARINAMNNAGATPLDLAFSSNNDAGMIALIILNGGLCNTQTDSRCPPRGSPIVGFSANPNRTFVKRSSSLTAAGRIAKVIVNSP